MNSMQETVTARHFTDLDRPSLYWLTFLASNCNVYTDYSLGKVGLEPWFAKELATWK